MASRIVEKAIDHYLADSGGASRFRGGLGQRLSFRSLSPGPRTFMKRQERVKHAPRGFLGGLAGAPGVDMVDGARIPAKTLMACSAGQVIRPCLQRDGGDLHVLGLEGNKLTVHYQGACGSCPSSMSGTLVGIEQLLKTIEPDIELVAV